MEVKKRSLKKRKEGKGAGGNLPFLDKKRKRKEKGKEGLNIKEKVAVIPLRICTGRKGGRGEKLIKF